MIEDLIGLTMSDVVNNDNEEIIFTTVDGERYRMYHCQDCCERVAIENICGALSDLIGVPMAEEVANSDWPSTGNNYESYTWTLYKFATCKGNVAIRWFGESNGYYSESVDFIKE